MADQMDEEQVRRESFAWQLTVGLFVALGCLATVAYTIVENFWG
jgi:hypothetical protein